MERLGDRSISRGDRDADVSCFRSRLGFMETSYDEAKAEYLNMLQDHIGEQLAHRFSVCSYLAVGVVF